MPAKKVTITLRELALGNFNVAKLTNTIQYRIGQTLTEHQVKLLIAARNITVNIVS